MRTSTALMTAACLGLGTLMSNAHAAPVRYDVTAVAAGDVNGPIQGWFTIDMDQLWQTYDVLTPDGEPLVVQSEEPDMGWGFINWSFPGDHRTMGSIWGAGISRVLHADGSSALVVETATAFSRGSAGEQRFTLTFNSATDALYTQRSAYLPLGQVSSATGAVDHSYSSVWGDPPVELHYTFTVTATAVPEPTHIALILAGLCVVGLRRHQARSQPVSSINQSINQGNSMHIKTFLATTAFSLSAALSSAQAAPLQFNFDAIAQGDVNGPISGSFTIDLAHLDFQYQETLANGTQQQVLMEWPAEGWGLVNWTLPGDARTQGSSWGATITRSLFTDGHSELTLISSAAFSHGVSGGQSFSLTFASDSDAMYSLPNPFASLGPIKSAIGSYSYELDATPLEYTHVAYQFALTGAAPASWTTLSAAPVPEPATWAMMGVGLMVVGGWRSRASRSA